MLIPRFSLRWLFGLTTLSAVLSLVVAQAYRGRPWAIAVASVAGTAMIFWLVHIAFFLVAWICGAISGGYDTSEEFVHSPFATDQPPPQIIEPNDPGVT